MLDEDSEPCFSAVCPLITCSAPENQVYCLASMTFSTEAKVRVLEIASVPKTRGSETALVGGEGSGAVAERPCFSVPESGVEDRWAASYCLGKLCLRSRVVRLEGWPQGGCMLGSVASLAEEPAMRGIGVPGWAEDHQKPGPSLLGHWPQARLPQILL